MICLQLYNRTLRKLAFKLSSSDHKIFELYAIKLDRQNSKYFEH